MLSNCFAAVDAFGSNAIPPEWWKPFGVARLSSSITAALNMNTIVLRAVRLWVIKIGFTYQEGLLGPTSTHKLQANAHGSTMVRHLISLDSPSFNPHALNESTDDEQQFRGPSLASEELFQSLFSMWDSWHPVFATRTATLPALSPPTASALAEEAAARSIAITSISSAFLQELLACAWESCCAFWDAGCRDVCMLMIRHCWTDRAELQVI